MCVCVHKKLYCNPGIVNISSTLITEVDDMNSSHHHFLGARERHDIKQSISIQVAVRPPMQENILFLMEIPNLVVNRKKKKKSHIDAWIFLRCLLIWGEGVSLGLAIFFNHQKAFILVNSRIKSY